MSAFATVAALTQLFFGGLFAGVFVGVWMFIGFVGRDASYPSYVWLAQQVDKIAPKVMRPVGILAIFMGIARLILEPQWQSRSALLCALATGGFIYCVIQTLAVNERINKRVNRWDPATAPADFEATRTKWRTFHVARTFAALIAFALGLASLGV